MILNDETRKDLETLKQLLSTKTDRAYFVGGCVRDYYLNRPVKDIDIEVYDIDEKTLDGLMSKLGADGIGKSFFVYKWNNFDISLPRTESKTGYGHKGFSVSLTNDTKEASSRRDFTINSMLINIFTDEVVDHFQGLEDLKSKTLRVVDSIKFKEDSLRVFRAMQFSSRLGFAIEKETIEICKSMELQDLSKERIYSEFRKMFVSEFIHYGIYYFHFLDIDKKLFNRKLSTKVLYKFIYDVKTAFSFLPEENNKYVFLFFLREYFGIKMEDISKILDLPREYLVFFREQPTVTSIQNEKSLLKLSVSNRLKNWIGLKKSGFYEFAKKQDLLENKLPIKITPTKLLELGFQGIELRRELDRRIEKEIEEYYEQQMGTSN